MRLDKNPFLTRASEYVDMEEKFIQLFSADILQVFNKDHDIWTKVNVFRSSPGGGKTTLLKLFTPKVLQTIITNKNHSEHVRSVFDQLKTKDVFDENDQINVIGAYIPFSSQFTSFDYLPFPEGQQLRIFFYLINVQTILAFLKSFCFVRHFAYPTDLSRLNFNDTKIRGVPSSLQQINNGYEVYQWAIIEEQSILESIDNINLKKINQLVGTDDLFALDLLTTGNITIDGLAIKAKALVMFDDVQNLTRLQRNYFLDTIIKKRPLVNTWVAERLKALTMEEMLSEGQTLGRDLHIIELERFWARKYQQFEKFAKSVANRRLEAAFTDQQYDFSSFLLSHIGQDYSVQLEKALNEVKARVIEKFGRQEQFRRWIKQKGELTGDTFFLLVEWRSLEIILHRESNRTSLFDLMELGEEDLEEQEDNNIRVAAQLFLHKEFNIPFYYGFEIAAKLSSSNIEQFLSIAAELFEEIKNNSVKRILRSQLTLYLEPAKQEQIIQRLANDKFKNLNSRVKEFTDIKRFLDAIGELCKSETYVPNAWNAPGINGVAITMAERNLLKDYALKDPKHVYNYLARCLVLCISYNLIDIKLGYRCKGKDLMLIYLNRLYCAKYNLPLHSGRFKEKNLPTLLGYLTIGFQPQTKLKM